MLESALDDDEESRAEEPAELRRPSNKELTGYGIWACPPRPSRSLLTNPSWVKKERKNERKGFRGIRSSERLFELHGRPTQRQTEPTARMSSVGNRGSPPYRISFQASLSETRFAPSLPFPCPPRSSPEENDVGLRFEMLAGSQPHTEAGLPKTVSVFSGIHSVVRVVDPISMEMRSRAE